MFYCTRTWGVVDVKKMVFRVLEREGECEWEESVSYSHNTTQRLLAAFCIAYSSMHEVIRF